MPAKESDTSAPSRKLCNKQNNILKSFDDPFSAEFPNLLRVSTDVCDAFASFAFVFCSSFHQSHASGLVLEIKTSAKPHHSAEIPF
jgi:hypothetical protein